MFVIEDFQAYEELKIMGVTIGIAAAMLALQVWLCFRVKSLGIRLIPAIFWATAALVCMIVFAFLSFSLAGVAMLGPAKFCVFQLIASGLGWVIWGIVCWRKTA